VTPRLPPWAKQITWRSDPGVSFVPDRICSRLVVFDVIRTGKSHPSDQAPSVSSIEGQGMPTDTVLCPDCAWTGETTDLELSGNEHRCPVCQQTIVVE
jgi:hypothetical protein